VIDRFSSPLGAFGNAEALKATQQPDRMFAVITTGGTELVKDQSFLSSVSLLVANIEGFDILAS
jgi:hypothetical protein